MPRSNRLVAVHFAWKAHPVGKLSRADRADRSRDGPRSYRPNKALLEKLEIRSEGTCTPAELAALRGLGTWLSNRFGPFIRVCAIDPHRVVRRDYEIIGALG